MYRKIVFQGLNSWYFWATWWFLWSFFVLTYLIHNWFFYLIVYINEFELHSFIYFYANSFNVKFWIIFAGIIFLVNSKNRIYVVHTDLRSTWQSISSLHHQGCWIKFVVSRQKPLVHSSTCTNISRSFILAPQDKIVVLVEQLS